VYDIVGCLIMPPSPPSLALAVQAKATRLAAATVMPPASRTVLRIVLRLSRVIGPRQARVGPLPMPSTTMTKACACQHPAISGLAGGQRLDQLADVAAGSTGSVALAASSAVLRFARATPLSLRPHRFYWRRSWAEPSPECINAKITTDSTGRIKRNR